MTIEAIPSAPPRALLRVSKHDVISDLRRGPPARFLPSGHGPTGRRGPCRAARYPLWATGTGLASAAHAAGKSSARKAGENALMS